MASSTDTLELRRSQVLGVRSRDIQLAEGIQDFEVRHTDSLNHKFFPYLEANRSNKAEEHRKVPGRQVAGSLEVHRNWGKHLLQSLQRAMAAPYEELEAVRGLV